MTAPLSPSDIAAMLTARIRSLAKDLLPNGIERDDRWCVGSIAGNAGRSLSICLSGDKVGRWADFAHQEHSGGPIDLVRFVKNLGIRAAMQWSVAWLGVEQADAANAPSASTTSASRASASTMSDAERLQRAAKIFRSARPIAREGAVGRYLSTVRGLDLDLLAGPLRGLRWYSRLDYCIRENESEFLLVGRWPALIVPIATIDRKLVGVQRSWIRADGSGKAEIIHPRTGAILDTRKSLGSSCGGACRLGPASARMAVTEGVEDGLSVAQACPDRAVWVACGANSMAAMELPSNALDIVICADADPPGERAAQALAQRLLREDRIVKIARPIGCKDFNDVIRGWQRD